jgi:hypothetical protein
MCAVYTRPMYRQHTHRTSVATHRERERAREQGRGAGRGEGKREGRGGGWGKARVARGERELVPLFLSSLLSFFPFSVFSPFSPRPPWTRVTGWRPLLYRTFARVVPRLGGKATEGGEAEKRSK